MATGPGGRSLASDHSSPIFAAALVTVSHVYSAQGEPPADPGQIWSKVTSRAGGAAPPSGFTLLGAWG